MARSNHLVNYTLNGNENDSVVAVDLNNDGNLDLVASVISSSSVNVLYGNGDGTFQAAVNYPVGGIPFNVMVADVNNDGKLDLVTANAVNNNVSVLLATNPSCTTGAFAYTNSYSVADGPYQVATGDFNRDGRLDLVTTGNYTNFISVLSGNGDGTFGTAVNIQVGNQPRGVAVADFNRDGKLDLAVTNQADNTLDILLGNGDGTFQSPVIYSTGNSPHPSNSV